MNVDSHDIPSSSIGSLIESDSISTESACQVHESNRKVHLMVQEHLRHARTMGHEAVNLPQIALLLDENLKLQKLLHPIMESSWSRVKNPSNPSLRRSAEDQHTCMSDDLQLLIKCWRRLKAAQNLILLVNNPQDRSLSFKLDQVLTLSQWEGDRQNDLEVLPGRSLSPWSSFKKLTQELSWKVDVPFRYSRQDSETCLSSLKKAYSFKKVDTGNQLGGNICFGGVF